MATLGIFAKETGLDPRLLTFCRLAIGGGLLGSLRLTMGKGAELRAWPGVATLSGGVILAAYASCYFMALQHTSMANAVTLLYLGPLLASLFAHLLLGERLRRVNVALIGLAVLGFAMLLEFRFSFSFHGEKIGVLYGLGSGLGYGAFIFCNRLPSRGTAETRSFWQLAVGAACLIPLLSHGLQPLLHADLHRVLWLAGLGLLPGFCGIYLVVYSLERIPTAVFAPLSYLEPLFVVMFGWYLYGESLTSMQAAGVALVLASGLVTGVLGE